MKVLVEGWILVRPHIKEPMIKEYLSVLKNGNLEANRVQTNSLLFIFKEQARAFARGRNKIEKQNLPMGLKINPYRVKAVKLEAR